ncbi:MAG: hypothetical protein HFG89_09025 [Dorea sp.]|nr:hypothetical protein [Dorea sp.]
MKSKKKYAIVIAAVCTAVIITSGLLRGTPVRALFDEGNAVHVDASEIENATLLIGTHLIHISAMNDEIYGIAADSASESNQQKWYYKSELAQGSWFDITDADSLKAITQEGDPVEDKEIESLFLTHHTRSDGVTYDLRTGQAVCMFDISNPYNLEELKELEALKIPFDMLADKEDKTEEEEESEAAVRDFFRKGGELKSDATDNLDVQIQALQSYFVSAGAEKRSVVLKTIEALDAMRRKQILEGARDMLNDLIESLQAGGESLSSDLNSGAGDSLESVEAAILEYDAKTLSEGTTTLTKEEYAVKTEMAEAAQAGDTAALDTACENAVLIEAIKSSHTGDAEKELNYLSSTILPAAKNAYSHLVTGGTGEKYSAAAQSGSASKGILNQALKDQLNETEAARTELQYLINSALEKMSADRGGTFLEGLLTEAEAIKNGILDDEFAPYAESSVESYLSYLNNLLSQKKPTENGNSLSALLEQKSGKQEEKQAALDANDLAAAKKADAEIEELNNRIEELEQQMSASGEAAAGESGTAPQTALQSAGDLAGSAVETIQDGSVEGVSEAIEGLGALIGVNPDAALGALKDIYQALATEAYLVVEVDEKANGFEECMTQIEDCIAENGQTLNAVTYTEDEAKELLEDIAGVELSETGKEEQAALLQASLESLKQQANEGIKKMAQILAAQMEADGNPYIFRQYNDPIGEYIPAETISKCLRYRYVFDNNQQKVTLSKGGTYYTFHAFSTAYEAKEEQGELKVNAGFQADIYLSEQDTQELFKCTAQYVPGCDLALLITEDNKEQASSYLSMLLTRLGG